MRTPSSWYTSYIQQRQRQRNKRKTKTKIQPICICQRWTIHCSRRGVDGFAGSGWFGIFGQKREAMLLTTRSGHNSKILTNSLICTDWLNDRFGISSQRKCSASLDKRGRRCCSELDLDKILRFLPTLSFVQTDYTICLASLVKGNVRHLWTKKGSPPRGCCSELDFFATRLKFSWWRILFFMLGLSAA